MISLISAADENNAIGFKNDLPWHLPKDMKFFKDKTWGMPIVMGRKSFEGLGKPLPGRLNVVITRREDFKIEGAVVVHDLEAAIEEAKKANVKEIMVIGGGEIYKLAIEIADTIYLTRVHTKVKEADAFFPEIDKNIFELEANVDFYADDKHAFDYSFQTWRRIS